MQHVIQNATVVTMNAQRQIWESGMVVIEEGRIVEVGPKSRLSKVSATWNAKGAVVLPGFVHAHIHACQTLFRNRADGLELLDWLQQRIWPLEGQHDAVSMRVSADLTFAEMIKSGATAALDMGSVHHYDSVFQSARDAGFRLTGGKAMMDAGENVPKSLAESTEHSLSESLRLAKEWHDTHQGRLRYAFAPRFVPACTEELLKQVILQSRRLGYRIHTHASENVKECEWVEAQTGMRNIAYFEKVGLLGPASTLAHCVHLHDSEIQMIAQSNTSICHCPGSNLKLASGYAPLPDLLAKNINVALGSDGAACNNTIDMFHEMRLAALMHLPRYGPTAVSAFQVLEMATLGGAKALGLENEIGTLEVGKKADLAVVNLSGLHTFPSGTDVYSRLVYSGRGSDVTDVMIDGECVLRNRELRTLDAQAIQKAAARVAPRFSLKHNN